MSSYYDQMRYDVRVALYVPMAAVVVCVCVQYLRLRRSYDLVEWSTHFTSEQSATMWARWRVGVTIFASYAAMLDLTREAVRCVQGLHPSSEYIMNAEYDSIEVSCAAADAIQAKHAPMWFYVVVALPASTSQWSE